MFFFSILSSNVFRVYIFNATLIINLNHISQTNTYPLNLYKMKMVRESILDIDFKKLMQMNRMRYLLIVFSEKITYTLYIRYIWNIVAWICKWNIHVNRICVQLITEVMSKYNKNQLIGLFIWTNTSP